MSFWVGSRSWWLRGRPGMLQSIGSQRVGHNWVTELNWTNWMWWGRACSRKWNYLCWSISWLYNFLAELPWINCHPHITTVRSLGCFPTCHPVSQPCHSFMDTERRYETFESETKKLITHGNSSGLSASICASSLGPNSYKMIGREQEMPTHAMDCVHKRGTSSVGNLNLL